MGGGSGVYRQKIRFQIEGLGVYNFVNSGLLEEPKDLKRIINQSRVLNFVTAARACVTKSAASDAPGCTVLGKKCELYDDNENVLLKAFRRSPSSLSILLSRMKAGVLQAGSHRGHSYS